MKRVLEPELMQDLLQVQAYSEADFSESDESLVNRIEEYLLVEGKKLDSKSLIVDVGCGPGNITQRLGSRWPYSKIIGIDGSQPMLAVARRRKSEEKARGSLSEISYYCCDIASLGDGEINLEQSVDLIVSNSCLHHVHDPSCFWQALECLSHKGTVHFHRDLRRPSSIEKAIALQRIYLPESPQVLIDDYLASLQASFTVEEVIAQLEMEGLEELSVYEYGDRYLEVVGTL